VQNTRANLAATNLDQEKRTGMQGGNSGHATTHKDGGDTDFQELEEPETLNVVIDGTSPSDYPVEGKRRQRRSRVLLAVAALGVVSVVLGLLFGFYVKNSSPPVTPTSTPTNSPSQSPSTSAPSPSPTQSPSASAVPTAAAVTDRFFSRLPPYSRELAESDPGSAQANALRWLQDDPLYNEYQNVYRLNQRYSLAVLYFSTNGASWDNRTRWLSNENECSWYTDSSADICEEGTRLSIINLQSNGLAGPLPQELELLTDLAGIILQDGTMSGTIPSEL
jgi:hypothetical protein